MPAPFRPDPDLELTALGQLALAASPGIPVTRHGIIAALCEAAQAGVDKAGLCEVAQARLSLWHMAAVVERWIATARAEGTRGTGA